LVSAQQRKSSAALPPTGSLVHEHEGDRDGIRVIARRVRSDQIQSRARRAGALLDRLARPSGLSDDEVMEKAAIIVNRAVESGMTSVQVFRFPNHVCTDNGRAINQVEEGWETTLPGIPKEIYKFWKRQLKPRGYHIRYEIIDYPGGMPGDVGIFLSWR